MQKLIKTGKKLSKNRKKIAWKNLPIVKGISTIISCNQIHFYLFIVLNIPLATNPFAELYNKYYTNNF